MRIVDTISGNEWIFYGNKWIFIHHAKSSKSSGIVEYKQWEYKKKMFLYNCNLANHMNIEYRFKKRHAVEKSSPCKNSLILLSDSYPIKPSSVLSISNNAKFSIFSSFLFKINLKWKKMNAEDWYNDIIH